MKNRFWTAALAVLSLTACKTSLNVSQVQTQKNIVIGQNIPEDGAADAVIQPYKAQLESRMNAKISHTATELTKEGDNSSLGNLLADYTLEGAKEWAAKNGISNVDAAVINIGGIRSIIGKGDIYLKSVYEVMPFENELVLVKMNGAQLRGLFDYYLKTQKNNPVSGFLIETENSGLTKALVNGKPIDDAKTYYIATSDYLALGGDNMKFFSNGEMIATGIKLRDLYVEKFKANPEVKASNDARLIFKDKKNNR